MILETVKFFLPKNSIPKMSSTDAAIHGAQYLIHTLKHSAPTTPLVTLVEYYTSALRDLAKIFDKATSDITRTKRVS